MILVVTMLTSKAITQGEGQTDLTISSLVKVQPLDNQTRFHKVRIASKTSSSTLMRKNRSNLKKKEYTAQVTLLSCQPSKMFSILKVLARLLNLRETENDFKF